MHFSVDNDALLESIQNADTRLLAKMISYIENDQEGIPDILQRLNGSHESFVVGVTGPPGSGKSTLVDGLIAEWVKMGKRVAVVCVDPSSPFHSGALLGDRIRMSEWYNHPNVFIRSLSSRGSLGGLHPKIVEISDLLRFALFDIILIETVGVGQTEVEIAALADTTLVVLVPEAGDEIQTMKAGLMEIADIFVVNKHDRPDADRFAEHLQSILSLKENSNSEFPVIIKTVAIEKKGLKELSDMILKHHAARKEADKIELMAEKAYLLILRKRMSELDKNDLKERIRKDFGKPTFNLYELIDDY
ncbi:MAG: methylmalonyl Co-A mutase-associated GTPase MeaB [Bacteroidetes bacterium]|nr:MAG: methylmalonyl Co-A mutase-associated GTPase MeaB [Bacteroidota bacterium]